jgi:3-oxoacyl-[acyl-carrier protein] reductase
MIDLSNQVALVTGGSRGIGAATAVMLAQAGADVAIIYRRDLHSARKILKKINDLGCNGITIRGRIENYADCNNIVKNVRNKFQRIDILVNNAGIWEYGKIGEMTPKQWQRTIEINLTGTFNMCNVVVPIMQKQKYGRIINISSTAGQRGEALHSHYAASKGGIIAFTKSLGPELIRDGIWVNCVAPGWVNTDMVSDVFKNLKETKEIVKSIARGKVGTPEEIAGPVIFLASHLADNIVGEILNVNGGSVLCG